MNDSSATLTAAPFWCLAPDILFLNHGSFGACPRPVLEYQQELRERLERQPVQFFARELEGRLEEARASLADFLDACPENLVFVPNATTGVNTVLRSFPANPGDEWLVTHHEYNACRNALDAAAHARGTRVVIAEVPFPLRSSDAITEAILTRVTPRTRLALLDHITSPTGLIFPLPTLVQALAERGVETLVDGAHAPGMLPLRLDALGAAYYAGNCHKWLCAPKGSGFLHVRPDCQKTLRPLVISHGANSPRTDRSRFWLEFSWTGTYDPTPFLSIPAAIRCLEAQVPGGWPEIMRRNHELVVTARRLLLDALGQPAPCPEQMLGALASIPIQDGEPSVPASPLYADPWQTQLWNEHRIEVPVIPWPAPPKRLLRLSAQLYNSLPQYEALAQALVTAKA